MVIVALVSLTSLALAGAPRVPTFDFASALNHGVSGFISAVAFVYISYAGVTKIAAVAEEVREPGRTLPRGILHRNI